MGAEMAPRAGQWRPTGLHLCFLCFLCPRCAGAGEQQQEGPRIIAEYDLAYLEHMPLHQSWEHLHAVVAIAGIVNRDGPVLFTPYTAHDTQADQRWRSHLTGTGQWLANATFSPIRSCPSGSRWCSHRCFFFTASIAQRWQLAVCWRSRQSQIVGVSFHL